MGGREGISCAANITLAGFAICYDANDRCCAIEFSRGISRVAYDGYELFEHPAYEVRDWARGRDPDLQNEDGFISTALGLSMYAPSIDEPDLDEEGRREPAQSFLAFRPGYYEEEQARMAAAGLVPEGQP